MKYKKQYVRITSERLNADTGELQSSCRTVSYNIRTDDRFFKVYTDHIDLTYGLSHLGIKTMFFLAQKMNYENVSAISGSDKDFLASEMKVTPDSVTKALTQLVNLFVVCRLGRGSYMVNPFIAAKGSGERVINLRERWEELMPNWNIDKSK